MQNLSSFVSKYDVLHSFLFILSKIFDKQLLRLLQKDEDAPQERLRHVIIGKKPKKTFAVDITSVSKQYKLVKLHLIGHMFQTLFNLSVVANFPSAEIVERLKIEVKESLKKNTVPNSDVFETVD